MTDLSSSSKGFICWLKCFDSLLKSHILKVVKTAQQEEYMSAVDINLTPKPTFTIEAFGPFLDVGCSVATVLVLVQHRLVPQL